MRLYTHCTNCKEEIKIKSGASTRPELQMDKGDEFLVDCNNCGHSEMKHVNQIKAKPNNMVTLLGVALGVIATVILWIYLGAIGTISIIIPVLFWQQEMRSSKIFNSYKVREKENEN